MPLPARNEAAKSLQPGEEPFDAPAMAIPSKWPSVLRFRLTSTLVRRDHLHPHQGQVSVEWVTIVRLVANQALGKCPQEPLFERTFDEFRFMALTTRNPDGDRNTIAVDHCHDLGRFAASSFANIKTPLFAPAWEPSM